MPQNLKTHAIIQVDSEDRTNTSVGISDFAIQLGSNIRFNQNRRYFCRLENVKIPITFYNINSNYNTLNFNEFDGVTIDTNTATIPVGNYTISDLIAELATRMNAASTDSNTYVITYDAITGKVNIAFSGGSTTVTILSTSTLNPAIGFSTTTSQVISTNVDGDNVATVQFIRYLKIITRLPVNNYYNTNTRQAVLLRVPITMTRYQFDFYENDNGYLLQLSNPDTLKELEFQIRDRNDNIIEFNGVNWSAELVLYELRMDVEISNINELMSSMKL